MIRILAVLAPLALVGCAATQAVVVEKGREAADDTARATLVAPCAMTVGAYNRLPQHQRIAVDLLCGGNALKELQGLVQ